MGTVFSAGKVGKMVQTGKVSIIIPVYNVEKYLQDCLESLLAQEMQDWEAILVDDGSADTSGEICDDFAKKNNRFTVIHTGNRGVSAARNVGIRAASGQYITFCDSDDITLPNWLGDLFAGISTHDCDFCCCDLVRGDSLESGKTKICYLSEGLYMRSDFLRLLKETSLNSPYTKIFRRDVIVENNILFDETKSSGEDLLFVLDYISCTKRGFYFINKQNYIYRVNGESLTHRYIKNYWENTLQRYDYLISTAVQAGSDVAECEKLHCDLLYDAIYYAIKNNFQNPSVTILQKLRKNTKLLLSKECRMVFASMANYNGKGKYTYTALCYLKMLVYQSRLVLNGCDAR